MLRTKNVKTYTINLRCEQFIASCLGHKLQITYNKLDAVLDAMPRAKYNALIIEWII